jgi:hypothetical protein
MGSMVWLKYDEMQHRRLLKYMRNNTEIFALDSTTYESERLITFKS